MTKAGTHPAAETAPLPVREGEELRMWIGTSAFDISLLEQLFDLLIILKFVMGVNALAEIPFSSIPSTALLKDNLSAFAQSNVVAGL